VEENKKEKNKGGKPRKEINWTEFDKLCSIQCTETEIASWFDMSVDTLDRRIKEEHGATATFAEIFAQKRKKGLISLRRKQYEVALSTGNVSMLIWLGKQYLDQKDKSDKEIENMELSKKETQSLLEMVNKLVAKNLAND
jgi:hypothetical protein